MASQILLLNNYCLYKGLLYAKEPALQHRLNTANYKLIWVQIYFESCHILTVWFGWTIFGASWRIYQPNELGSIYLYAFEDNQIVNRGRGAYILPKLFPEENELSKSFVVTPYLIATWKKVRMFHFLYVINILSNKFMHIYKQLIILLKRSKPINFLIFSLLCSPREKVRRGINGEL